MFTYALIFFAVGILVAVAGAIIGITASKEAKVDEKLPRTDAMAAIMMFGGATVAVVGVIIAIIKCIILLKGLITG